PAPDLRRGGVIRSGYFSMVYAIRRYHSLRIAADWSLSFLFVETVEPFAFLSIGTTCRVCTYSEIGNSAGSKLANIVNGERASARVSGRKRLVLGHSEAGNPNVCPLCPIKPLDEGYRPHSGVLCSAFSLPAACCAAQHIMSWGTAGSGVSFFTA